MKRFLQTHSLALGEEEMENRPRLFMRSYRSNEIAKPHQQPSIEEKSTKGDASLIDLSATDNQFMPPIPSSKKEKSQLVPICNQGEFFIELKEVKQGIALEEVF